MKREKISENMRESYSRKNIFIKETMHSTGDEGELIAIRYLQKHDFSLRDTNFRFGRFGEIDLIAERAGRIHFIEVKYRRSLKYGSPEEAVIPSKLRKCQRTLEFYCKKYRINPENIQFDVIAILKETQSYKVTHYKNISL